MMTLSLSDLPDNVTRLLGTRGMRQGLAVRSGLPQQVFVGLSTETKPCVIDLTRPVHDNIRCTLTRSPQRAGSDESDATLSEMLPTPDRAWLPGSCGRRYASPPRLRLVAPAEAVR